MKKKRILATLLCGAMAICSLAGCGKKSESTGGNDDYPTIVMAVDSSTATQAGSSRISKKISEITREKYGVNVELEVIDDASYKQQMQLMLSSGEQVDIFNAVYLGLSTCANNGYVLDLEENNLIETYGKGIIEVMKKEYLDACRVDGTLYGLPTNKDVARGLNGFAIGAEYLDAIGYDYNSMYTSENDEIIYTDMETINDIFAQLHEKYPDKYVIAPSDAILRQGPLIDDIGGDYFGVLADPANSLEVVDYFQTEEFRELCDTYYAWNQAGYISQDALTDDTPNVTLVSSGTALSIASSTKPGIKRQVSGNCGREMIVFQAGEDFVKSSSANNMPWCINANTENPQAAMEVLNGFYTDPELSNLLIWGEEGVEYEKTDDGHITFPDGVNSENSEYYLGAGYGMPNQFIAHVWDGDDLDIWEKMEEFNNNGIISKALGFTFDTSEVASEYTALTNVYNEYIKTLIFGFTEPEAGIAEFEEKLQAAGLEKYIAEKQAQLDEWAASK